MQLCATRLPLLLLHARMQVEERATFAMFPIVERTRLCMPQAAGVITAANSSTMLADVTALPKAVQTFR